MWTPNLVSITKLLLPLRESGVVRWEESFFEEGREREREREREKQKINKELLLRRKEVVWKRGESVCEWASESEREREGFMRREIVQLSLRPRRYHFFVLFLRKKRNGEIWSLNFSLLLFSFLSSLFSGPWLFSRMVQTRGKNSFKTILQASFYKVGSQ